MPEADTPPTTSRRAVIAATFGAPAALLLLAAPAAGPARAAEPDGDLIEAGAEYIALVRRNEELGSVDDFKLPPAERAAWDEEQRDNIFRSHEIIAEMVATPARTPEGLKAKARALKTWIACKAPINGIEQSEYGLSYSLALDLLRDLAGEATP